MTVHIGGDKCLQDGCSKIIVSRTGYCKEHRKTKCRKCDRDFVANTMGLRICCNCHAEVLRKDLQISRRSLGFNRGR
jgi:hypothetical protein